MARVIVPICALRYSENTTFPVEAADVFYRYDLMEDDAYSYTFQIRVLPDPDRAEIRQALREQLPAEDADRLIKLLDANDWDVSFFVDSFEKSGRA